MWPGWWVRASRWAGPVGRWAWSGVARGVGGAVPEPARLAALTRIAADAAHPEADRARRLLAVRWLRTRDPDLRAAVLSAGATAAGPPADPADSDGADPADPAGADPVDPAEAGPAEAGPAEAGPAEAGPAPHLVLLALHGRLAEAPAADVAAAVPHLLADPDPAVRESARRACATSDPALLTELWSVLAGLPEPPAELPAALLAGSEPVPAGGLAAAWQVWVRDPDQRLWRLLAGRPAPDGPAAGYSRIALGTAEPAELCAAVLADGTPEHLREQARDRCVRAGLAPGEPADQAAFFLLTGQLEQYRAADPDGELIALAYRAGSAATRTRLRAAMVGSGGLDLLRVLAANGAADPIGGMTEPERHYLVDQLAARQDWPALWAVTRALPLVEAVPAARRFAGWRPDAEADAALLARLAAAPETLVGRHSLARPPTLEPIRLPAPDPQCGGWFSPDDTAATVLAANLSPGVVAQTRRLLDGERLPDPVWPNPPDRMRLLAVAPAGTGYAAVSSGWHLLLTGAGTPGWRRAADLRELRVLPRTYSVHRPITLAVDPGAEVVAVGGNGVAMLTADGGRLLDRGATGQETSAVAFAGSDRVVALGRQPRWADAATLTAWQWGGGRLTKLAERQVPAARPVRGLAGLAGVGRVAAVVGDGLAFYALDDLVRTDPPAGGQVEPPLWEVWSSQAGDLLAVGVVGAVEVRGPFPNPLPRLIGTPIGDLGLDDLHLARMLRHVCRDPAGHLLAELAHARLIHRFGADVSLGDGFGARPATGRPGPVGGDDIGLA